ncbi:MAG TPA: hypothetical protein PK771_14985, partial [Spirochaetota bacterium]|nr:hypothetical protein [Spirochaetota bacterium]
LKLIGGLVSPPSSCNIACNYVSTVNSTDDYISFAFGYTLEIQVRDLKIKIPYTAVSSRVSFISGTKVVSDKMFKINYPKTLTLNQSTAKTGDKITITSSEPFFDKATFSKDKLDFLLKHNYKIVWVESDDKGDYEKRSVTKEYYVDVTSDSVTFIVPDYAKTGKVHVVNEYGFIGIPRKLITIKENAPAFFSTAEDLVITP